MVQANTELELFVFFMFLCILLYFGSCGHGTLVFYSPVNAETSFFEILASTYGPGPAAPGPYGPGSYGPGPLII